VNGRCLQVLINPPKISYPIRISHGDWAALLRDVRTRLGRVRYLLVTDENVARAASRFITLARGALRAQVWRMPPGERSKSFANLIRLHERMSKLGMDRDSCVLALGGGTVGDLAGLAAATYKRGVSLVQTPTTLLAMVDSSLGGKTAVNTSSGKNLFGAFYQPKAVYADTAFLKTLPQIEYRNGLAELIKIAAVRDRSFFSFLESRLDDILRQDPAALISAVRRGCALKADVVARDEKDAGMRLILNFGHTVGHAIEKESSYRIAHGSAVAMGSVVEAALAKRQGWLTDGDFSRLKDLLIRAGLPARAPALRFSRLWRSAVEDKKVSQGEVRVVLLKGIGRHLSRGGDFAMPVKRSELREAFQECRE
jgi:3-dehydroquinate synthase